MDELTGLAGRIIQQIPPKSREISGSKKINASAFADLAREEINYYQGICPGYRE